MVLKALAEKAMADGGNVEAAANADFFNKIGELEPLGVMDIQRQVTVDTAIRLSEAADDPVAHS